jgi:hypothetical protein
MRDSPFDESHRPATQQQKTCQRHMSLDNCIGEEDVRFCILFAPRDVAPTGKLVEVRVLGCWHCPNMDDLIANG